MVNQSCENIFHINSLSSTTNKFYPSSPNSSLLSPTIKKKYHIPSRLSNFNNYYFLSSFNDLNPIYGSNACTISK